MSRRRSQCSSSAILALTVVLASAASPNSQAAASPAAAAPGATAAFVSSHGNCAKVMVSRSARVSRGPRARRPGGRRLEMQAADAGPEAESGGDGDGGVLTPTVFPPRRPKDYTLKKGQVGVRFINTSGDPDVTTAAYPGEIVTKARGDKKFGPAVAKRAGVKIATACNSGICGTCMTDLEDANGKGYRPGFQVVRACVTPVSHPRAWGGRDGSGHLPQQVEEREAEQPARRHARPKPGMTNGGGDGGGRHEAFRRRLGRRLPGPDNNDKSTPAFVSKDFAGTLVDPATIRTPISYNAQERMERRYMYDDLPETVRRSNPPGGGRDLEEKMDAARQVDIRQRLQRERRERVNYYLDLAYRPIANTADIMALSQEEVDSRSRFFNKVPDTWEEAYGPANLPEVEREIIDTAGRRSEGISEARMAVYRSARQIPRYRFFGDPPLKEQDEAYFASQEDPMRRIKFEDAAELDRLAVMSGETSNDKNYFVYRDSRTGRVVPPHKAGSPGTLRAEMREKQLPTCGSCEGSGVQACLQCRAMGINAAANGLKDLVCTRCSGQTKVPCAACAGSGVGRM
ncbi:unnamed protein product [Scytosiphon promiscuus]